MQVQTRANTSQELRIASNKDSIGEKLTTGSSIVYNRQFHNVNL